MMNFIFVSYTHLDVYKRQVLLSKQKRMKGRSQYAISEEMEVTNMTTDRSLLEDMLSDENLNKAYLQVVKNKEAEGVNGMKYTELKDYLKEHGIKIK